MPNESLKMKKQITKGMKTEFDLVIFYTTIALVLFGIVMVFSASYVQASFKHQDGYFFLKRDIIYAILGFVGMMFMSNIDYTFWKKNSLPLCIFTVICLALVLTPLGIEANGAKRWLGIGGATFQPSDIAKFVTIVITAKVIEKRYENIKSLSTPCYTYGIDNKADFMAKNIKIDARGVSYTLVTPTYEEEIFVPVPGKFTVYNTLAVIAACYMLNIPKEIVKESLGKTKGVAGRFETITNDKGISVIVDYAHTPDALENILNTAKGFAKSNIITVFGCGGDRDTTKRPLMGAIAQKLSDVCIVTSDNPRTEDPQLIIEDILKGLDKNKENYRVVVDRREAIKEAIEMAQKDDIVIIAGKGHENYQILGKVKHHFDDKEIAQEFLNNK